MDHNEALQSEACEKYLLGELSAAGRDAFEEHYFSCAECASQLRLAAEFLAASREILASTPQKERKPDYVRVPRGWLPWRNPLLAGPAFAALLLFIGYQNFVTIPHFKQAATPRVLPMHSLIAANSRGAEGQVLDSARNEPLGLYVDIPTDPAYSLYLFRLEDPSGKSSLLSSVTAEQAQKTQVVAINPGTNAGKYMIVISGLAASSADPSSAKELARLQFTVELRP